MMSEDPKQKESYLLIIKRNSSVVAKRLGRRDSIPLITLLAAAICTLLLLTTYHPDIFSTTLLEAPNDGEMIDQTSPIARVPAQPACLPRPVDAADGESSVDSRSNSTLANTPHGMTSQHRLTKHIEVLGNDYRPKTAASMPSWLPKAALDGNAEVSKNGRLTEDSRQILANNRAVASYTQEPDSDSLLILTPIKNNAKHLARYFALIDRLKYPRDKISIAFLVSDSTDDTQQMLIESRQWYQEKAPEELRFRRFDIYRQDFFYSLPRDQRHLREKQRERRIMMARARNYLWTRALGDEQWVLWIDGDLEFYPPNIVRDLMAYDKDVIVPNCLVRKRGDKGQWKHTVYDRNAWQETDASRAMIATLKEDDFLVEGYQSLKTHRKYLDNFKKNETLVPLDGVGGTFTLLKAHVHRSGVGFPAWLFQHQVETEGFAKLAKANGFGVFGLPFYYIRHVVG